MVQQVRSQIALVTSAVCRMWRKRLSCKGIRSHHQQPTAQAPEDGRVAFIPVPSSGFELEVDLVLLAMGFLGPQREGLLSQLGVRLTDRGNVSRDANWMTSVGGVFAAGDMQRGQSLIVWAIAEGRSAAAGIDRYLMGETQLPMPVP